MKDWFLEFSKTPLGTAICIGAFVLVCVIYVFSCTSIGKKALKSLFSRADKVDQNLKEHKDLIKDEVNLFEKEVNNQLHETQENFDEFKKEVFNILKVIPNKKVKDLIKRYENNSVEQLTTEHENNAE